MLSWRAIILLLSLFVCHSALSDVLPSWSDGASRTTIVEFVERVAKPGGAEYVAPQDRIAVFDNDGTLWSEMPADFQLLFAIDRVKALAPQHPEWKRVYAD